MTTVIEAISEYCTSEYCMFLDSDIKVHAEPILLHWCKKHKSQKVDTHIEKHLFEMASLNIPLPAKKKIPHLLTKFYAYLTTRGIFPESEGMEDAIAQLSDTFQSRFRDNGTYKGETFKKKYSPTGRNDSCPCGSGKKFKKCCMKLIT